jgi:hypothetical protein
MGYNALNNSNLEERFAWRDYVQAWRYKGENLVYPQRRTGVYSFYNYLSIHFNR